MSKLGLEAQNCVARCRRSQAPRNLHRSRIGLSLSLEAYNSLSLVLTQDTLKRLDSTQTDHTSTHSPTGVSQYLTIITGPPTNLTQPSSAHDSGTTLQVHHTRLANLKNSIYISPCASKAPSPSARDVARCPCQASSSSPLHDKETTR